MNYNGKETKDNLIHLLQYITTIITIQFAPPLWKESALKFMFIAQNYIRRILFLH